MSGVNKPYIWILFWVSPFLAVVYSLRNFRATMAKNVMWAFAVFFGMAIAVGKESQGSDINRYMEEVTEMYYQEFNIASAIEYFEKSSEIDILRTFLSVLVSRFTSDGYVLLIVYGFIFGYFYSRNVWYILDRLEGKLKVISMFLIALLFLITPL